MGAGCGNEEGRKAELSGWAGGEAGCLQLRGLDLSSPRQVLCQTLVSGGPHALGGDQVIRRKVGQEGAGSERGKMSGAVPVEMREREENRQEKIQRIGQGRLNITTLGVPISTHQQSKLKPRVSRPLPKAQREKDLRTLPSNLFPEYH